MERLLEPSLRSAEELKPEADCHALLVGHIFDRILVNLSPLMKVIPSNTSHQSDFHQLMANLAAVSEGLTIATLQTSF